MKRRELLALLPVPLLAQRAGGAADPVLKAMVDEMARAKSLGVAGGQPIYYMECVLDDVRQFSAVASLGGLMSAADDGIPDSEKWRCGLARSNSDNTNYVLSDVFFGTRFDGDGFPLTTIRLRWARRGGWRWTGLQDGDWGDWPQRRRGCGT